MDVRDPRRFSGDALRQRIVVGEIGIAAEARAAFVLWRLVAVGPRGNVVCTVSQLGPARKIHVDAGGAYHQISWEHTPGRIQYNAATCFPGGFDWRALVQMKIGVASTTVVGRLRKAFPHFEDGTHEAPTPRILQIAEMSKKTAEG